MKKTTLLSVLVVATRRWQRWPHAGTGISRGRKVLRAGDWRTLGLQLPDLPIA